MSESINRSAHVYFNEAELSASLERARKRAESLMHQMQDVGDKSSPQFLKLQKDFETTTAKADQLSKKLSGDLGVSIKDMQLAISKATNELNKLPIGSTEWKAKLESIKSMKAEFAGVQAQVTQMGNAMQEVGKKNEGLFGKIFGAIAAEKLFEKAYDAVKEFFTGSIEEAEKAQAGIERLTLALENMGDVDALPKLTAQADALAEKLRYLDNDDIIAAQEKLVTYGKVTTAGIQQLIPVIIDYAAKTKKELGEATDDIIKGLEGQGKSLKLLGIELEKGGSVADNFAVIMGQLGDKVKGSAEVFKNSFAGGKAGLTENINSLKESLGTALLPVLNSVIGGINGMISGLKSFLGISKTQVQQLQEEQTQLQLTETQITSYNVGTEQRTKLLDELKARYPELLSNLDSERAGNEEVHAAIQAVNNSIITKIALQESQEKLEKNAAIRAKAENQLAQARLEVEKAITELVNRSDDKRVNQRNKQLLEGMDIMQQAAVVLTNTVQLEEVSTAATSGTLARLSSAYDTYNAKLSVRNAIVDGYNKILAETMQVQEDLRKQLGASLQTGPLTIGGETDEEKKKREDALKKQRDDYDKLLADIRKLQEDYRLSQLDSDKQELERLKAKYAEIEGRAKGHAQLLLQIQALYTAELQALEDKQFDNRSEKEYQATQNTVAVYIEVQKQKAKALYATTGDEDQYYSTVEALEFQLLALRKQTAEDYAATSKQAADDVAKYDAAINDKIADGHIKVNKAIADSNDARTAQELKAIDEVDKAREEAQRKEQERVKNLIDTILQYAQAAGQVYSTVTDLQNQYAEAELARDREKYDARKEALKKQLDAGIISEQAYNDKVAEIERQKREKERSIKREEFARDKAAKIVESIINTAVGVTKALPNIPLMVLAGVLGGIQTAAIAAQPVPQFGKGGKLAEGPLHDSRHGGLNVVNPETGRTVAQVERDEWIINRNSSGKYNGALAAINRDDEAALIGWIAQRPRLSSKLMQALTAGTTHMGPMVYDDGNVVGNLTQLQRLQVQGAQYMVKGIVEGLGSKLQGNQRKL